MQFVLFDDFKFEIKESLLRNENYCSLFVASNWKYEIILLSHLAFYTKIICIELANTSRLEQKVVEGAKKERVQQVGGPIVNYIRHTDKAFLRPSYWTYICIYLPLKQLRWKRTNYSFRLLPSIIEINTNNQL